MKTLFISLVTGYCVLCMAAIIFVPWLYPQSLVKEVLPILPIAFLACLLAGGLSGWHLLRHLRHIYKLGQGTPD